MTGARGEGYCWDVEECGMRTPDGGTIREVLLNPLARGRFVDECDGIGHGDVVACASRVGDGIMV